MRKILNTFKDGKVVKVTVQCECGNISTTKRQEHARKPDSKCHKCTAPINAQKQKPKHQGIGDISLKMYGYFRRGARVRKLEFSVSLQYLWDLFIKQDKKCALSGVDITFAKKAWIKGAINHKDITASLDRIDSKKGYVEGNVQWLHKQVNRIKWILSDEELIHWCKLIAKANPDPSPANNIEVAGKEQRLDSEGVEPNESTSARQPEKG